MHLKHLLILVVTASSSLVQAAPIDSKPESKAVGPPLDAVIFAKSANGEGEGKPTEGKPAGEGIPVKEEGGAVKEGPIVEGKPAGTGVIVKEGVIKEGEIKEGGIKEGAIKEGVIKEGAINEGIIKESVVAKEAGAAKEGAINLEGEAKPPIKVGEGGAGGSVNLPIVEGSLPPLNGEGGIRGNPVIQLPPAPQAGGQRVIQENNNRNIVFVNGIMQGGREIVPGTIIGGLGHQLGINSNTIGHAMQQIIMIRPTINVQNQISQIARTSGLTHSQVILVCRGMSQLPIIKQTPRVSILLQTISNLMMPPRLIQTHNIGSTQQQQQRVIVLHPQVIQRVTPVLQSLGISHEIGTNWMLPVILGNWGLWSNSVGCCGEIHAGGGVEGGIGNGVVRIAGGEGWIIGGDEQAVRIAGGESGVIGGEGIGSGIIGGGESPIIGGEGIGGGIIGGSEGSIIGGEGSVIGEGGIIGGSRVISGGEGGIIGGSRVISGGEGILGGSEGSIVRSELTGASNEPSLIGNQWIGAPESIENQGIGETEVFPLSNEPLLPSNQSPTSLEIRDHPGPKVPDQHSSIDSNAQETQMLVADFLEKMASAAPTASNFSTAEANGWISNLASENKQEPLALGAMASVVANAMFKSGVVSGQMIDGLVGMALSKDSEAMQKALELELAKESGGVVEGTASMESGATKEGNGVEGGAQENPKTGSEAAEGQVKQEEPVQGATNETKRTEGETKKETGTSESKSTTTQPSKPIGQNRMEQKSAESLAIPSFSLTAAGGNANSNVKSGTSGLVAASMASFFAALLL
ncbi:UNVERIFIED_CONTAM: hypothetical protein HDU68_004862 [Siphonaria sp. JEL0065]|nr:hypothetical protein HDU68_004862 [Siphonaria sp. JEL0065]